MRYVTTPAWRSLPMRWNCASSTANSPASSGTTPTFWKRRSPRRDAPLAAAATPEPEHSSGCFRYSRDLLSGQHALHRIAHALAEAGGQRPRAGLAHDVQMPALIQHFVVAAAIAPAVEAEADHGFRHAQVMQRDFRQPRGKMRIEQQSVQRSIGI